MIVSPWGAYVISVHHQPLTASAQPRHRSRMQCNAGACKTTQLHLRIHLATDPRMRSIGVARGPTREFSVAIGVSSLLLSSLQ